MPDTSPQPPRKVVAVQRPYDRRARPREASLSARQRADRRARDRGSAGRPRGRPGRPCICGGACGGDLLFAEAALARVARLELYIPFDEPTFLEKSVDFANRDWRARYFAAKARSPLHVAPSELGPIREGEDAYERNNRWMLDFSAPLRSRQGRFRLPVERRGRRRAGWHAPHDGRGPERGRPDALARHDQALGLTLRKGSVASLE